MNNTNNNNDNHVVVDPVTGKEMDPIKAYAEVDGLFFESLQSQQLYYNSLANGYEIEYINGKPNLVKNNQGEIIWQLHCEKGNYVKKMAKLLNSKKNYIHHF